MWLLAEQTGPMRSFGSVMMLFFLAIGLVMLYSALTALVNRTQIIVGPDLIQVRHTPFPWPGGVTLPRGTVRGLFVARSMRKTRGGGKEKTYVLNVVDQNGRYRPLVSYTTDRELVEAVLSQLTERLGLADGSGSFSRDPNTAIPIPPTVHLSEHAGMLGISYRPPRAKYIILVLFALLWCSFVAAFTLEAPWFFLFFLFPFWVAGPGFLYYALVHLINTKRVHVSSQGIASVTGPLPWFGGAAVKRDDVAQLWVKRDKLKGKGETTYTFAVHARTQAGTDLQLVGGLEQQEEAAFIERKVEHYLGIDNEDVSGEVKS